MKVTPKLICIFVVFWLALAPVHAAQPTKAKAKTSAKKSIKAKAGAKAKPKANATRLSRPARSALGARFDPANESSLDSEVAAARRIVTTKPGDVGARERLARASVAFIDLLLDAEALGDTAKVERLSQKIATELHDAGWRVQKMSQKGDLRATQATGYLLARGLLLQKDTENSCAKFLIAAEKLAPAGWHAAHCLMANSPDRAWEQMERAAQRGHAAALEWMGRRCLGEFGATEKDFVSARVHLAQSASLGRSRAQTLLAYLLASGQGGPADVSRAIRLYKLAAERGDADAQNNLGEINEMGRGVEKNLQEAIRWYELAAQRGLGSGQFNAGRLWAIGVGEKKDPARARDFLVQAEGNGIPQARQILDWLDRQDVPASVEPPMDMPSPARDEDTIKN